MAIILARHGTPAARLERTVIQDEDYLQKYIYENPDVLPLDQLRGSERQGQVRENVSLRSEPRWAT
jgi:hypothetical protein